MKRVRGFTFIEILIVLVIIGILAGMATVSNISQRRAAEYRGMRATVYSLCQAVKNRFYTGQGITGSSNTGQTNSRYLTNIVETTFGDYEVQLTGATFRIRVGYWPRGATTGSQTATYLFDAAGAQTSCTGADCMTG